MLPNFVIIGTEKGATTWLATCLAEHPDVFMSREKELYFFAKRFHRGLSWYEAHFTGWGGEAAVGEATPVYLSDPDAPARMRKVLGADVRLIASVRHPVDRAYSAFWHNLRLGRIPLDADFRTCFERDMCEIRERGYYFTHLTRFLEHFSREQLLVLVYEQLFQHGQSTIDQCLSFLGLDPGFTPRSLRARINEGRRDIRVFNQQARALRTKLREAVLWGLNTGLLPRKVQHAVISFGARSFNRLAYAWGPRARPFARLDGALRQELLEKYYMREIRQLEQLLERDLSPWYESPRTPAGATTVLPDLMQIAASGPAAPGH
jgi:hypothetical protein